VTIRLLAAAFASVILLAAPVHAAGADDIERLTDALNVGEMMSILRDEGMAEAQDIGAESFPGRVPATWTARMERIYDAERLETVFGEVFATGMAEADAAPLIAFFESDLGREVVRLELTGRRAFISEDVEQAARDAWSENDDSTRAGQLARFIEVNDLLERNVSGALNSTLAFYQGLAQDEMFAMSEEDMLREAWAQEGEIRDDTEGWLYAYLGMSYQPLSEEDLDTYIDLSASEAGQALNAALFEAFDRVFDDVSFRVGEAIAQLSGGEEL
jgi:hypothetical protein